MATYPAYSGPRPQGDAPTSIWAPLRQRVFFAIWAAALASNIGTWMQNVGAAWLMTTLAPTPLKVALIQTASSLPIFILALPAGALADVVDRRRLLIFSQGWMLVAAGLLGGLTLAGITTPWALLVLSFALGLGAALNAPAWQAIVPEVVSRADLTSAIALNGINFNLARAVGPALGGLVVSSLGPGATFVLNAVSFLGVMVVLYGWKREHNPGVLPAERIWGAIRAGLRYVRHAPPLRAVLARTAAFVVGGSAMWAVLPLVAREELHMTAGGYGSLLAAFGTGAVAGGAMLPWLNRRMSRDMIVAISTLMFAGMTAALALLRFMPAIYVMMAIGGAGWTTAMSVINVAAQLSVPEWVQGRALSCYQIILQGGMALGAILWGVVAERWQVPASLLAAACSMAIGMLTMWRYSLAQTDGLALDLLPPMPAPETSDRVENESGPVLVSTEYSIDPSRAGEFEQAMVGLRTIRRRDGATFWGLFFDAREPEKYVEYFVVDSWIEHLRQHGRLTMADKYIQDRVRAFQRDGKPPIIRHQIAAQSLRR
ncbi:MAG TPA: MFS transporter [Candidatus Binataceae bacterium]|nr:MFS transporter [Candidatus Binataceae bacterium]